MSFRKMQKVIYASDFETTTDDAENVEVWSAESIEVNTMVTAESKNCVHQTNIDDFIMWLIQLANYGYYIVDYFHNLKFDGSYILDYFVRNPMYTLYSYENGKNEERIIDRDGKDNIYRMKPMQYTYMISDKNVIYSITLRTKKGVIEFRDSLKLLPFSLRKIAKDFNTPHKKLEMNYKHKKPGYKPTAKEMAYIENDVYVLKEALEILAKECGREVDNLPLTIGAMAMSEYKEIFKAAYGDNWDDFFPSQVEDIPNSVEGLTYDEYVRKSYKGGWCYCSPRWRGRVITQQVVIDYLTKNKPAEAGKFKQATNKIGFVFDVNSLYPSVMHSMSGSFYPIGKGTYNNGDFTDNERKALDAGELYGFMHISLMFHVKPKHLPCIQIKNDFNYDGTEWLETSDVYNKRFNVTVPNTVDMYVTYIDWKLIQEQYDLTNVKVISHITYKTVKGIFDMYIDKWAKIKQTSKGARRQFAKLMLNNLYGKFSTSPLSSYMLCYYDTENEKVARTAVEFTDDKRAVYIPIGSAITSWARNFTIRHAQDNYDLFCYADTDSIHCIGTKDMAKGIVEDPVKFCCWKNETCWQSAIFAGQKRYIERVTQEDGNDLNKWYYNIRCCGMGTGCKDNLNKALKTRRLHLHDFKEGLEVPGNLKGHIVTGGTYLQEQSFIFH